MKTHAASYEPYRTTSGRHAENVRHQAATESDVMTAAEVASRKAIPYSDGNR